MTLFVHPSFYVGSDGTMGAMVVEIQLRFDFLPLSLDLWSWNPEVTLPEQPDLHQRDLWVLVTSGCGPRPSLSCCGQLSSSVDSWLPPAWLLRLRQIFSCETTLVFTPTEGYSPKAEISCRKTVWSNVLTVVFLGALQRKQRGGSG